MKKIVGIIGGKGGTGRQFAKIFEKLGFTVIISDLNTKLTNRELIENSDIVLFSVPLHLSEQIIEEEIGNIREDQIVLDVSSLKEKQVNAMNNSAGQVLGMHPLFGPIHDKFKGLAMVLCPGNCSDNTTEEFKKMFEKLGMKISVMKPSQHDKMMAAVQVIPHLKAILSGELLREFKMSPDEPYDISTPIYKLELDIIGRIFSQDGTLYSAIIANNPYSKDLIKSLREITEVYEEAIEKGDIEVLNNRFNKVKKFFGDFSKEAFVDSQRVIDEMQKWK